jgi:hypothetical protein
MLPRATKEACARLRPLVVPSVLHRKGAKGSRSSRDNLSELVTRVEITTCGSCLSGASLCFGDRLRAMTCPRKNFAPSVAKLKLARSRRSVGASMCAPAPLREPLQPRTAKPFATSVADGSLPIASRIAAGSKSP